MIIGRRPHQIFINFVYSPYSGHPTWFIDAFTAQNIPYVLSKELWNIWRREYETFGSE